jgi:hypothetical protein
MKRAWAFTKSDIIPSGLAPLTKSGSVSVARSFTVTASLNHAHSCVVKAHVGDTKRIRGWYTSKTLNF